MPGDLCLRRMRMIATKQSRMQYMHLVRLVHSLKRSRDIVIESFLLAGTVIVVPVPNMNAVFTVRVNTKD